MTLDSARNILLDAGQSTATSSGSNHSAGVEVGVGYEVGAKTGAYIYATANVGNGNYNNSATTNSNTQLSGDTVTLASKGDTTLKGATVKANTINADVGGKLAIESVQDTSVQHNEQSSVGGRVQVSIGTAWEASGNVGQSTANGSSNAVNQQSGLFAGNGGYHVTADTVALKGGAIASSNAANSELTAKSITFENLTNKMDYSASTVSMSGGYGEKTGDASTQTGNQGNAPTQTSTGASNPNVTPGIPLMESGSASSTTYGTLTDGKITIGGQHMTSAAGLGAHTDLATAHTAIAPLPDLKNVMANQQAMAAAANTVIATGAQIANDLGTAANKKNEQAQAVLNNKDSTQAQKEQAQQDANDAQAAIKNWGPTGDYTRALKVVTGILVGGVAGEGVGQLAANASAPYAAQAIGDYFAQPGHDNQTVQLLTHAVLGGILAAANGGSALAGAGAGAAGELAAKEITRQLYPNAFDPDGSFHPEKLDANQINTVISLSTAVGALVAGATGGSLLDASVGGNIAANAATYNRLLSHAEKQLIKDKAGINIAEADRLTKAACYELKCWAQYPEGSKGYNDNYVSVMDAYDLKNEIAWIKSQQAQGQFVYSAMNDIMDHARSTDVPIALNGLKVATGWGTATAGIALCGTGIGCAPGSMMIAFGSSNMMEGGNALYNAYLGNPAVGVNPLRYGFNQVFPVWGNTLYDGANLAVTLGSLAVPVPRMVGASDGIDRAQSLFGSTTSGFNNLKMLPFSNLPYPYGVNQAIMIFGVGAQAVTVTNDVLGAGKKK